MPCESEARFASGESASPAGVIRPGSPPRVTIAHLRAREGGAVDLHPGEERVAWLGHATVLLEVGGARLLTDPLLRDRVAHLRRHAPAPPPDAIEDVDAVLVS